MTDLGPRPAIAELRARVASIESADRSPREYLPFGIDIVDAKLPGGGLSLGALHEVAGGAAGVIDTAAAALFAAGILGRIEGSVLWCMTRPAKATSTPWSWKSPPTRKRKPGCAATCACHERRAG